MPLANRVCPKALTTHVHGFHCPASDCPASESSIITKVDLPVPTSLLRSLERGTSHTATCAMNKTGWPKNSGHKRMLYIHLHVQKAPRAATPACPAGANHTDLFTDIITSLTLPWHANGNASGGAQVGKQETGETAGAEREEDSSAYLNSHLATQLHLQTAPVTWASSQASDPASCQQAHAATCLP